jgi:hypothetical protein
VSGENAAKAMPGYRKAMTGGFYPQAFDAATPAPPDAPSTLSYSDSPLVKPAVNEPPTAPDRMLRGLSTCGSCGGTFGFNGVTDAAVCPRCAEMDAAVTPTYTPGTPWF